MIVHAKNCPWVTGVVLTTLLTAPVLRAADGQARDGDVEARMRKDATFLASPQCEGRGPTTAGLLRAGDYLAAEFQRIGLKPGNKGSYFQPFTITGAVGTLRLAGPLKQSIELVQGRQFLPLGYDQPGQAAGDLVFAGYGLRLTNPAYDDYAGLDVKGKIVVLLRDTPRATTPDRSKELISAGSISAKLVLAHKLGAVGVLLVNDAETAEESDGLLDFSFTTIMPGGGPKRVPAAAIKRAVLESMLPAGRTLTSIERDIDRELKPISMPLTGWTAELKVERVPTAIPLRNIVGVLEGAGPLARETIVIGAHYDHLGYGSPSSLFRGKKRAIHHGADDNASGTSALLELARRYAAQPQRQGRRLVFIAFSGEELGLFGSAHYCKQPLFPLEETAAMFNLDMVGRLTKEKETGLDRVLTEGHGTASGFKELIDNQAKKHGFTLKSQASGIGPSDHASFTSKRVPVLFVWTGTHPDYHKPSDTVDKLNFAGMRRIVAMSEEIVNHFTTMERPKFIEVKGTAMGRPSSGPRLGIRPGYSDAEGVEVEGVTPGSVAEKGGIKEGDRIVSIAGNPVKNINTYMQTMGLQKKGNTIEVQVVRGKQTVKLKVTLE
ncbi:MAG: M28 family peptidase [Gemmataceae bacterium]